jgi:TolA-binding protein
MQAQLTDINNGIKVLQTPPPVPPAAAGTVPGVAGQPGGQPAVPAVPPMSATDLYNAATSDRNAGNLELAMEEYVNYLKYYSNTELAGNAQFYIGSIHYSQGAYDSAVADFDAVLEKYPDSNKVQEAHYWKGMSLKKSGKRTQSRPEFIAAVTESPRTGIATKACDELKDMGFPCPAAGTPKKTSKKR